MMRQRGGIRGQAPAEMVLDERQETRQETISPVPVRGTRRAGELAELKSWAWEVFESENNDQVMKTFPHFRTYRPRQEVMVLDPGWKEPTVWKWMLYRAGVLSSADRPPFETLTDNNKGFVRNLFIESADIGTWSRIKSRFKVSEFMGSGLKVVEDLLKMMGENVVQLQLSLFDLEESEDFSKEDLRRLSDILHVHVPKFCLNLKTLYLSGNSCGRYPSEKRTVQLMKRSKSEKVMFPTITTLFIESGFNTPTQIIDLIASNPKIRLQELLICQRELLNYHEFAEWCQLRHVKTLTLSNLSSGTCLKLVADRKNLRPIMGNFTSMEKLIISNSVHRDLDGLVEVVDKTISLIKRRIPVFIDCSVSSDGPDSVTPKSSLNLRSLHLQITSYDSSSVKILRHFPAISELNIYCDNESNWEDFYFTFDWDVCRKLKKIRDHSIKKIVCKSGINDMVNMK